MMPAALLTLGLAAAATPPRWFLPTVDRALAELAPEAMRTGLTVTLDRQTLHLDNVVERCAPLSKKACKAELDAWLRVALTPTAEDRPNPAELDWQTARPMLRLRPYPIASLDPQFAAMLGQMVGVDTGWGARLTVVLDTPSTAGTVHTSAPAAWGVSQEDVQKAALDNTRGALRLERTTATVPVRGGREVEVTLWTGGFYTTSAFADPSLLVPASSDWLFVAPGRDGIIGYEVSDLPALVDTLPAFAAMGLGGPAPGQGVFSTSVYWWHDGVLRELPTEVGADGMPLITAGKDFAAFLETLPAQ